MTTFQDIEPRIMALVKQGRELAFMTREQIFDFVAELVALSDDINNRIRDIDVKTLVAEQEAIAATSQEKMSASMASLLVKQASKKFKPDRDWLSKQAALLSDMRIAALAAQRGAE